MVRSARPRRNPRGGTYSLLPAHRPGARSAERRQDRKMTTKKYETAILFDPELPEDARKDFVGKLSGIIAGYKGEVLKIDDWGNRKLAYTIRKRSNAFYTFLLYTGSRGVVEEVERNIKIFDGILRHLTSRVEIEVKAKPAAAEAPPSPEQQTPTKVTPTPATLPDNLMRDPEIRYLPSGLSVTSFGLAVNSRY